jgi:hypothetical protein
MARNYIQIGNGKAKCQLCGEKIKTGIPQISHRAYQSSASFHANAKDCAVPRSKAHIKKNGCPHCGVVDIDGFRKRKWGEGFECTHCHQPVSADKKTKYYDAEGDAYSYAYNDGHSDSRKREEYRPNLSGAKQESDFKKILKQKSAESKPTYLDSKNAEVLNMEEPMVEEPDFMPNGDGRAIGQQNFAINLSPLHAENEDDFDEDKYIRREEECEADCDGVCNVCWDGERLETLNAEAVENEIGCDKCGRFAKLWSYATLDVDLCAICSKKEGFRAESFSADGKRPQGMTSTRFRHKETGEIATRIPISEMRLWEKLDAESFNAVNFDGWKDTWIYHVYVSDLEEYVDEDGDSLIDLTKQQIVHSAFTEESAIEVANDFYKGYSDKKYDVIYVVAEDSSDGYEEIVYRIQKGEVSYSAEMEEGYRAETFEANAKTGNKVYIITRRCEDYSEYSELDVAGFGSLTEARKKFNLLFKEEKEQDYADETIAEAKDSMSWGADGDGMSFNNGGMIYELREVIVGDKGDFYFDAEATSGGLHSPSSFDITWEDLQGLSSPSMPPNEIHFSESKKSSSIKALGIASIVGLSVWKGIEYLNAKKSLKQSAEEKRKGKACGSCKSQGTMRKGQTQIKNSEYSVGQVNPVEAEGQEDVMGAEGVKNPRHAPSPTPSGYPSKSLKMW